jgi:hypothetical protein
MRRAGPEAEYRPLLLSIAYRMTGPVGDAEDIRLGRVPRPDPACLAGTMIADPKAHLSGTARSPRSETNRDLGCFRSGLRGCLCEAVVARSYNLPS